MPVRWMSAWSTSMTLVSITWRTPVTFVGWRRRMPRRKPVRGLAFRRRRAGVAGASMCIVASAREVGFTQHPDRTQSVHKAIVPMTCRVILPTRRCRNDITPHCRLRSDMECHGSATGHATCSTRVVTHIRQDRLSLRQLICPQSDTFRRNRLAP